MSGALLWVPIPIAVFFGLACGTAKTSTEPVVSVHPIEEALSRVEEIVSAAQLWAARHQNDQGQPEWPTSADVDTSPTDNFVYEIVYGSGVPATVPLIVSAFSIPPIRGFYVWEEVAFEGVSSTRFPLVDLREGLHRIDQIIMQSVAWANVHPDGTTNHPTWPGLGSDIDLSPTKDFTYAITAGSGADATTSSLNLTATGQGDNGTVGVTIVVVVDNIASRPGAPIITGLPMEPPVLSP